MDVVNPEIEEIGGIFYRINVSDDYNVIRSAETTPYIEHGDEDDIGCTREVVNDEEDDVDIQYLDDGRSQISFHVPQMFHSFIIGSKGGTKQRLEMETRTYIQVPKRGDVGDIVVVGKTRDGVLSAYRRLKVLVATARSKSRYTHFVSIPMTKPHFIQNYLHFKNDVLNEFSRSHDIKEGLFQNPAKLHLTAGVMLLADDEERNLAIRILMASKYQIVDPIFQNHAIRVHVRGVECMNDDPSQTNVLYARIEKDSSHQLLQDLVDYLVDFFVDKNLMAKERDHVKLHITLMNTHFINSDLMVDGHFDNSKKVKNFDASKIVEKYKDFDFGEVEINSIHLSQRHTVAMDGYYVASCKITFF